MMIASDIVGYIKSLKLLTISKLFVQMYYRLEVWSEQLPNPSIENCCCSYETEVPGEAHYT